MATTVYRNKPYTNLDHVIMFLLVGTESGTTEYIFEKKNGKVIFLEVKYEPAQYRPWEWEPECFTQASKSEVDAIQSEYLQQQQRRMKALRSETVVEHDARRLRKNLLRKAG